MAVSTRPALRRSAALLVAFACAATLSGCVNFGPTDLDPADFPVGLDEVQSATLQITAQGEFYEPRTSEPLVSGWYGSGFIISRDGLAITNNHVAAGATSFDIRPGGGVGPAINAEVVSTSECLDLAVIQLPPGDYPFMAWRQDEIAPPLEVYSAGFPNGTPAFTLTSGIVSTGSQSLEFDWASVDAAIEHDARIRGGNSGGPLIDQSGRVVGVNYAGDNFQDYNYAIAREQVLSVLDDLIAGENVLSLGINGRALPLDEETGDAIGIWVQSVQPGSAAEAAGIQAADILIQLDGVQLSQSGTMQEYCEVLQARGADAPLDVLVVRPLTGQVLTGQVNGTPLVIDDSGIGVGPRDPSVESFVEITDDTGAMVMQVPESWSDVIGAGFTDDDGSIWDTLVATPDFDAFVNDQVPGAIFIANPNFAGADPATYLAIPQSQYGSVCASSSSGDYTDGIYTGLYGVWEECSTGAVYYFVAANADDGSHFIRLSVTMLTDFDASTVIERILSSFVASY